MFDAVRNVIYAFAAICCALIGLFWLWFLYAFSLRWLSPDGTPVATGSGVFFGQEGAEWIGILAAGWFALALLFAVLQWRHLRRQTVLDNPAA